MILKEHELIQITNNPKLIFNSEMDIVKRGKFYYELMNILKQKGLYLYSINKVDEDEYLYRLDVIKCTLQ